MSHDTPPNANRRNVLKAIGAAAAGSTLASGSALAATVDDDLDVDSDDLQEALVTFDGTDAVDRLGDLDLANGFHGFEILPVGYAELTGSQIEEVASWSTVRRVTFNEELQRENDDARSDTNAGDVQTGEGLDLAYTGENVHAAVIDTGIDGAHPDLEENLEANWQWVGDPLDEPTLWEDVGAVNTDDVGHGTHCAGSIGGTGAASDGDYAGMAPSTTLTAYSTNATLLLVKAVAAYDHMLDRQRAGEHEIHVASNSYGSGPGDYDPYDPLNTATWIAYEADILVTFSAGNDGPGGDTLGRRKQAPYVLGVAACNADQSVTDFSSRGDPDANHDRETAFENHVELYSGTPEDEIEGPLGCYRPAVGAKGRSVMSTMNPAHPLQAYAVDDETWYGLLSGTSMANPVAAGCAALVIDAHIENYGEVPDPIDVINTLEATADADALDDVDDPNGFEYTAANVGTGYVDALGAAQRVEADDLADFDDVDLVE